MSTTQAELDRIRAEREYRPMQQQTQSVPQRPSAASQATGMAGQVGGMAAGNYIANTMAGSGAAGAGATGAGLGSGSLTISGSVPAVGATGGTATVGAGTGATTATTGAVPATGVAATALPVAAALYGIHRGVDAYGDAKGQSSSRFLRQDIKNPYNWIAQGPRALGGILGSDDSAKNKVGNLAALVATGGFGAPLIASWGGKKDKDQMGRDAVRKAMQQQGALDEGFNLSLADGTKFNIGLDGGGKFKGYDGSEISPYNVDVSNPFAHQAVAWADPIAAILTGGDPKLRSDFAGYFSNAAMSNAQTMEGVRANALNLMAAHKVDFPTARQAVDSLLASGKIDQGTRDAYMNSLGVLESGNSKLYDTRTVQQVQQAQQVAPQTLPAPTGGTPLTKPPANVPTAAPTPMARPTPQQQIGGQPVSAFQKLIDEAKRREQGVRQ